MSYFYYWAVTREGSVVRGNGDYPDALALDRYLARRGEELYRYWRLPRALDGLTRFAVPRLRTGEVVELCRYLASYSDSGLDLAGVVGDLAAAARRAAARQVLQRLQQDLADGYRLSEAMVRSGAIPQVVSHMALIGEESGGIATTLADAAAHLERTEAAKAAMRRSLIYPGFTLATLIGGAIFWLAFVVPRMVDLFRNMDMALPGATRLLIAGAAVFDRYWALLAAAPIAFAALLFVARRYPGPRCFTDDLLWRLPLLGAELRAAQIGFYLQYLALLYRNGIPITSAMETVANGLSNTWFRQRLLALGKAVRGGEGVADSFARSALFDPSVARMLAIGEQTGTLEQQLGKLADIHYQRLQTRTETAGKLLEPLILITVAAVFGFFALALLGPLYQLIGNLGAP